MKAVLWTENGAPDVLQLGEAAKPAPKDNEVLIRINAATVTTGDCEQRRMEPAWRFRLLMRIYTGLRKPKRITILGMELAGEVESAGKDVKSFKKGDQVFAATGFVGMGSCAEYICMPENSEDGALAIKPVNMSFEQAAAVPMGGLEALHFCRQGIIQSGQRVLINGAGGTIGTFAVQLAKVFGAEVTAVDSTGKLAMLRNIGADHVIDYTRKDFTEKGETYHFILDVANKSSFSGSLRSLEPKGRYIIANPSVVQMVRGRWTSKTTSRRVVFGGVQLKTEDLIYLKGLIEEGKIISVIDRCYPLEQTAEAHAYVESGQKKGSVVIRIEHDNVV